MYQISFIVVGSFAILSVKHIYRLVQFLCLVVREGTLFFGKEKNTSQLQIENICKKQRL